MILDEWKLFTEAASKLSLFITLQFVVRVRKIYAVVNEDKNKENSMSASDVLFGKKRQLDTYSIRSFMSFVVHHSLCL